MDKEIKEIMDEATYWPNDWLAQVEHLFAGLGARMLDEDGIPLSIDEEPILFLRTADGALNSL